MASESRGWQSVYEQSPDIYNMFAEATDPDDAILGAIESITPFEGKTILDIGTGTGKYTFKLCGKAKHVIGVDKCSTQLDLARKKQKALGAENVEFILDDVSNTGYRNFFDMALSAWALNAPWNGDYSILESALKSVTASLKDKGWFFMVTTPPGEYAGDVGIEVFSEERLSEHYDRKSEFIDYLAKRFGFAYDRVNTGWRFDTVEDAYRCFDTLYGKEAGEYVLSKGSSEIGSSAILLSRNI